MKIRKSPVEKLFRQFTLTVYSVMFLIVIPSFANTPIRNKAIEDRAEQRMTLYRERFGTKDARLANALQGMWFWYRSGNRPEKLRSLIEEWIEIYPKLPAADQRYCARHALYSAREMHRISGGRHFYQPTVEQLNGRALGERIASCVLTAMNKPGADWTPEKTLTEELKLVTEDSTYPEDMRQLARAALRQKMRPEVKRAYDLVDRLKTSYEVPHAPLSSAQTKDDLDELSGLYPKLRDMDKRDLTGDILRITSIAKHTDAKIPANKLLWLVFDEINPAWMDNGAISGGLTGNASYYFQKEKDFATVAKLFKKSLELREYDGAGQEYTGNEHMILGDAYLSLGRKSDAKQEYETALKIENSFLTSGLMDGLGDEGSKLTQKRILERIERMK